MGELNFDVKKVLVVDASNVQPNSWNPKNKGTPEYLKIKKSLQSNGQRQPIVVREAQNGYEIIDGEQRFTAMVELGYDKVIIYNEGKLGDKQAKALTIWYEQQVPFDEIMEAKLVAALTTEFPDVELPYTDAELEELKKMAEFDFEDLKPKDNEGFDEDARTFKVTLSKSAYDLIVQTINNVMEENDCGEARALELICADYQAGH